MRISILFCFVIFMFGCRKPVLIPAAKPEIALTKPNIPKPKTISLSMESITATDLQENLSFQDELIIQYSLARILGDQVKQVETVTGYIGKIHQGEKIKLDTCKRLQMVLQAGERLGVQVSVWEVDDYTKDQKLLRSVNQWGGLLQIPMTLLEWSSFNNPVSWFLWGARIGGFGLDWMAKRDVHDLIGVSEIQWDWADLPKGNSTRFKRGKWTGGQRGISAYSYGFAYQIHVNDGGQ